MEVTDGQRCHAPVEAGFAAFSSWTLWEWGLWERGLGERCVERQPVACAHSRTPDPALALDFSLESTIEFIGKPE